MKGIDAYKPAVSVIIPVYKAEAYIERCARSLFGQTLKDMEFVFIDDASPDRSVEVLRNVLEEYPARKGQVRIISLEKNSGVAAVRARGLREITGDYFIYCDSDDYVDEDAYEEMLRMAWESGADVVVCDLIWEYKETFEVASGAISLSPAGMIDDMLRYKVSGATWNKMFSSKLLQTSQQPLRYSSYGFGEDLVMCLQLIDRARVIAHYSVPCYHYVQTEASITRETSDVLQARKFQSMRDNLGLLSDVLNLQGRSGIQSAMLGCAYYNKKNLLYRRLHASLRLWWLWVSSYPSLLFHLSDLGLSRSEKILYTLAYLGITPYSAAYRLMRKQTKEA